VGTVQPPALRSLGLSATSQQYFSLRTNQPPATTLRTNQPPATSQQYFSLRTNQHQSSATSQTNKHINSTTSNQPSTQGSADPTSGLHSYGPLHPTLHAQSAKKKKQIPKLKVTRLHTAQQYFFYFTDRF
jgi:hypothetical protein